MIASNKILFFRDRVDGDRRPVTADIYLTDYCNNRCGYCRFARRSGKYMGYGDFVKVYNRLVELGVRGFILTGGGEPTINPDFDRIAQFLEREGVPYGCNTNFNVYKEFNPVFLKVSLDEGDKDRYRALRGADTLDKVVDNVRRFFAYRKETGGRTRIGVQCVTTDLEQVRRFYGFVRTTLWDCVDYVQFRPVEKVGANQDYSDILEYLDRARKWDDKIYISYKYQATERAFASCRAFWTAITVDCEGMVHYCCNRPDMVLGSVFDGDILQRKERCVPDMSKCERPCRLTGANLELEKGCDNELYFV